MTGTTGVAHSECETLRITPLFSNLLSSSSTLFFMENGSGLALQKMGFVFSSICSFALKSFRHPGSVLNKSSCSFSISVSSGSSECPFLTANISFHGSFNFCNHVRPSKGGPFSSTIIRGRSK